jgi:hypothetical protein
MHYFEDGGSTYHGRFRTWDFIRGQEYDRWKPMVGTAAQAAARKVLAQALRFRRRLETPAARDQLRVHAGREGLLSAAMLRDAASNSSTSIARPTTGS